MRHQKRASAYAVAWAVGSAFGLVALSQSALADGSLSFQGSSVLAEFSDISGLSAEALFTLIDPNTLEIRLRNTTSSVPGTFDAADQILTGVSWDFGHPGFNGDTMITGGSVVTGATSVSLNFDNVGSQLGPGEDISGEWGYGNMDGTGALTNFISGNAAQAIAFGGLNLDGPLSINGPQGGIVANPLPADLGGLGAVQDEIISVITLSIAIFDLDFLFANEVRFEFGSDAAFFDVPSPASISLLGLAGIASIRRRRR